MNKRTRRKKHTKEFIKYGLELTFKVKGDPEDIDKLCEAFIDQVEALGCLCGGVVGQTGESRFTVEVGSRDKALHNSRVMINWILMQQDLGKVTAGERGFYFEDYLIDVHEDKPTKVFAYKDSNPGAR